MPLLAPFTTAPGEPPIWVILLIVLVAFPVAFVLLWTGIVGFLGALGWKGIAARYPATDWPDAGEGAALGLQTGRIGAVSYRSTLDAVLTDEGLHLRPMALFKFNHPPLFVPWSAVERVEKTALGGAKLYLRGGGSLVFYWKLGRLVRERFGVA